MYKIKHYIITRFFCVNGPLGDKLFDESFLKERFNNVFAPNMLKSISNIDGDFDLIILIHENIENHKVEFLNECSNLINHKVILLRPSELSNYIYSDIAKNDFDFICESRMDYDDFVFSDVIKDIDSHIDPTLPIKMYGYTKGYTYNTLLDTLFELDWGFGKNEILGQWSICQTLMFEKSFLLEHPDLTICNIGDHTKTKIYLSKFCEKCSLDFSKKMFEYNDQTYAFVYYRHPAALSVDILKTKDPDFTADIMPPYMSRKLNEYISPEYLKKRFSFEYNIKTQNK